MEYYLMCLLLVGFVGGLVAVASNPSTYFAAFGLVMAAGTGCGVLFGHGSSFLSLVLFLIYLGGMLVVFAYSAALAADLYPESWGSQSVAIYVVGYVGGVVGLSHAYWVEWGELSWVTANEGAGSSVVRGDTAGVSMMYADGGVMLFVGALVLFLALFVVLELTRGLSRGTLRAV